MEGSFNASPLYVFQQSRFSHLTEEAMEAVNIKVSSSSVRHSFVDEKYGTISLGVPLDKLDLDTIKKDFIRQYFPWIAYVGDYFVYIVGTLMVVGAILCCIDFVVKFVARWKRHGRVGCWMLTLFLNGGFADAIMPAMIALSAAKMQAEKARDLVELMPIAKKRYGANAEIESTGQGCGVLQGAGKRT